MRGLIPHYCIDYCNYVLSGHFQVILHSIRAVLNTFVLYIVWCWRKEVVHVFYLVSCSYSNAFYGKRVGIICILYFTDGYIWSYLPVHHAKNALVNGFLQCTVSSFIYRWRIDSPYSWPILLWCILYIEFSYTSFATEHMKLWHHQSPQQKWEKGFSFNIYACWSTVFSGAKCPGFLMQGSDSTRFISPPPPIFFLHPLWFGLGFLFGFCLLGWDFFVCLFSQFGFLFA